MPIRFIVENFELVLDARCLSHREFRAVVDYDQTPGKLEAHQDLLFVMLMFDEDGDYKDVDEYDKLNTINSQVYLDQAPVLEPGRLRLRDAAQRHFEFLNETEEGRSLQELDRQIADLRHFMTTLPKITEKNADKRFTFSSSLAKLVGTKIDLAAKIESSGGKKKKKQRNQSDTITTLNESREMGRDKVLQRRNAKLAAEARATEILKPKAPTPR